MKNAKNKPYTPADLEIITLAFGDIITTSGFNSPESDDGEVDEW